MLGVFGAFRFILLNFCKSYIMYTVIQLLHWMFYLPTVDFLGFLVATLAIYFTLNKNVSCPWGLQSVPQIRSICVYIMQFKMPNTHRISFPGVAANTHVKFYFTQTFYIMRVIISPRKTKHSWFSIPPLDCRVSLFFFSSPLRRLIQYLLYRNVSVSYIWHE